MPQWTLISNHGLVLSYIARHREKTAREIASALNVTEWTVHKLIDDLEKAGYIKREKIGRKNEYEINPELPMRHETIHEISVGDVLRVLGWKPTPGAKQSALTD